MEALADRLIDTIAAEQRAHGFFHRTPVIVPNKSMERYLTIRFAARKGIESGITFPFLMSMFGGDGAPEIDAETIRWRIFRILPDLKGIGAFSSLNDWLKDDPVRRYELAGVFGELYNKYLLYRPDWINAWEHGVVPDDLRGTPDEHLQGELWRRIAGDDWRGRHFAAVFGGDDPLTAETAQNRETGAVRLFGFSSLAPSVLHCLERIGRTRPVELYQLVPSVQFYGDSKPAKAELNDFVRQYMKRDVQDEELQEAFSAYYFRHHPLVASFAAQSSFLLNATIDWTEAPMPEPPAPEADTVLRALQAAIREDRNEPDDELKKRFRQCRSVQIRDCYSEFREVEAAHNFILHCMEELPGLTLNDVFIMTPEPGKYAPLVDAVFNHSGEGGRLRVSVADRSEAAELPAYRTFLKVLSLYKGDFTAPDVFGILQDAAVQRALGVAADDCEYLMERCMSAGIRWGWDASDHAKDGGTAFPENTWLAGFDRMLLNYAVETDPAEPFRPGDDGAGIFAVPGFEGQSRAVLLGKFAAFAGSLRETAATMKRRELRGEPFAVWKDTLNAIAQKLFGADSPLQILLLSLLKNWENVLTSSGIADDAPLTSSVVLKELSGYAERQTDSARGFLRGAITFCGLRPMRSIPARVIALLGMDHQAFPVQDDALSFDLTRIRPRAGDPGRRQESRQLFLDVLMSARDRLFLSYAGRDQHDGKKYPPSSCVDELRTCLRAQFGEDSYVDIQEPLQAFSPGLFVPGAPNQSYSQTLRDAAELIRASGSDASPAPVFELKTDAEAPAADDVRITPDDLAWFLLDPAGKFLAGRLDAAVSVRECVTPEDAEAFQAPPWLDNDVKDDLYGRCLRTADGGRDELKQNALRLLQANGVLPPAMTADEWAGWDAVASVADRIAASEADSEAVRIPAAPPLTITNGGNVTLDVPPLEARLKNGTDAPYCLYIPQMVQNLNAATVIHAVVRHLSANLTAPTRTSIVAGDSAVTASPLDPDSARERLARLLDLYARGMRTPLKFFPKTAWALHQKRDWSKDWYGDWNRDGEDGKFARFFGPDLDDDDLRELEKLADTVFGAAEFREAGEEGNAP